MENQFFSKGDWYDVVDDEDDDDIDIDIDIDQVYCEGLPEEDCKNADGCFFKPPCVPIPFVDETDKLYSGFKGAKRKKKKLSKKQKRSREKRDETSVQPLQTRSKKNILV